MDVIFYEEVSYFVKPSSDSPLQGERGSEMKIREDGMDNALQVELRTKPIMLRDTNQLAIDDDQSTIIPKTISTNNPLDVPNELPFDDQLPTIGMTNKLPVDGSSSDDSTNDELADVLTKAMSNSVFSNSLDKLGYLSINDLGINPNTVLDDGLVIIYAIDELFNLSFLATDAAQEPVANQPSMSSVSRVQRSSPTPNATVNYNMEAEPYRTGPVQDLSVSSSIC
ncbi:hypothetical protein ACFX1X_032882 [Malus domestica]